MLKRRMWSVGLGLALCLALAAIDTGKRAQAAEPKAPKREQDIKIGVVETLFRDIPPKGVEVVVGKFTELIQMQTGYKVHIEVAGDALSLGKDLADGKYHMAVFNGFEFAWAREKTPDLQPLLIAVNRDREVSAHLLVRCDDNICAIKNLKGKSLAQPWRCREFARLFLERRCLADLSAQPNDVFESIVETPTPEEALDMVVDKEAHAVIVDSVSLKMYQASKGDRAKKLKDLDFSKVFPQSVLAYSKDALPQRQIDKFHKGMLCANESAKGKELLKFCGMTSFDSVPENYETLLQYVLKEFPVVPPQAVQTPEHDESKNPVEVKEK